MYNGQMYAPLIVCAVVICQVEGRSAATAECQEDQHQGSYEVQCCHCWQEKSMFDYRDSGSMGDDKVEDCQRRCLKAEKTGGEVTGTVLPPRHLLYSDERELFQKRYNRRIIQSCRYAKKNDCLTTGLLRGLPACATVDSTRIRGRSRKGKK